MSCQIRMMRREDITQVTEIDRQAFPTQWPSTNYENEFKNQLAYYIVAYDDEKMVETPVTKAFPEKNRSRLVSRVKRFFNKYFPGRELPPAEIQYIPGFAGFWIMAGEAHITNIAVREIHRRQGIGELLVISLIDLALELNAHVITLEVRASNTAAQSLYSKNGFTQVGLHPGYYIDNKEDGVLMSTEDITSASFKATLHRLKQAHARRWGIARYQIGP